MMWVSLIPRPDTHRIAVWSGNEIDTGVCIHHCVRTFCFMVKRLQPVIELCILHVCTCTCTVCTCNVHVLYVHVMYMYMYTCLPVHVPGTMGLQPEGGVRRHHSDGGSGTCPPRGAEVSPSGRLPCSAHHPRRWRDPHPSTRVTEGCTCTLYMYIHCT